ncbi:hypothetical protein K469DRAFT_699290 [Zopfia rhizophila CBS 207.26]|uniref:Uncharacterized protein n=1 Tax=Zopfia rhizophila CBS 207.26 TaxID=1314779 RepID=A0A6A6F007_9PEZI|nr:hypothetical protein K469DRAFT_699290 [Zopfia rhizophila CBS 207.26]
MSQFTRSKSYSANLKQEWREWETAGGTPSSPAGNHTNSEYFRHQTFTSSSSYQYVSNSMPEMAQENASGPVPFPFAMPSAPTPSGQNANPLYSPGFSASERESITRDCKRFEIMAHMIAGIPLGTTYGGHQNTIVSGGVSGAAQAEGTTTCDYQFTAARVAMGGSPSGTFPGKGCETDHGAPRYAFTVHPATSEEFYLRVHEDTATQVNWISPKAVEAYNLEAHDAIRTAGFADFTGEMYVPKKKVKITWTGKPDKSVESEFFVGPENSPFELLVGSRFIQEIGHAHKVFLDEPAGQKGTALIMTQKRLNVEIRAPVHAAG